MPEEGDVALNFWEAYTDSDDDSNQLAGNGLSATDEISDQLRRQKLSDGDDDKFTTDIFSGSMKTHGHVDRDDDIFASNSLKKIALLDPFSQINLKCLKDCESTARKLSQKIGQSSAKSAVWLQFLDILFQACEKKLELRDLQTLKRKIENTIKSRETEQRDKSYSKKKPNGIFLDYKTCISSVSDSTNSKNYQDELDMLYGDLSDDEEVIYDDTSIA